VVHKRGSSMRSPFHKLHHTFHKHTSFLIAVHFSTSKVKLILISLLYRNRGTSTIYYFFRFTVWVKGMQQTGFREWLTYFYYVTIFSFMCFPNFVIFGRQPLVLFYPSFLKQSKRASLEMIPVSVRAIVRAWCLRISPESLIASLIAFAYCCGVNEWA